MKCLFIIRIIRTERVVCDFLAHGIIAVELKAINYLEAYDLDLNKKIKIIQKSDESQFRQLQPRRSLLPRQSEQ